MIGFKFCPKCGGELKQKKKNMSLCLSCGFEFYIPPYSCNAAILENDKGEILLIKRKWPPKAGYYDLPGGFIDLGETLEESMQRELKEELGIYVENLKFYKSSEQDRYLFQGINYYTLCFYFLGNIGNKKLQAFDDVGGIELFSKDKVPVNKFAFKSMKKIIKDYLQT